jgi:hypothetical protein
MLGRKMMGGHGTGLRAALFALSAGAAAFACAGATKSRESNADEGGSSDAAESEDVDGDGSSHFGGGQSCNICEESGYATFTLSCSPNDLTSVVASGPCSMPDASQSRYTKEASEGYVDVASAGPGNCHIQLTFATGFTYSADVSFKLEYGQCAGCTYLEPTSAPFMVNNPSNTCVDAGVDAGVSDAGVDAPTDAASDAAVDAQAEAGVDE